MHMQVSANARHSTPTSLHLLLSLSEHTSFRECFQW